MKDCLIITGGSIDYAFAGSFLQQEEFSTIIAVDAGLAAAKKLGLVPHMAVGDFDTLDQSVFDEFHQIQGITWQVHQPEKDETDTELALRTAMEAGCKDITILGATGGRMDHALGNIHLLQICLKNKVSACIVDPQNKIYLLDSGRDFDRDQIWGKYISFLPLTEQVFGITLTGFRYPLTNKDIRIGTSLCISNELTGQNGSLSFTKGILICMEAHD